MTRRSLPALAIAAAAVLPASAPAAVNARLDGTFAMRGVVTRAVRVPGERRGASVRRRWTFAAPCATGVCDQVTLTRPRAGGVDTLILQRAGRGVYTGSSAFFVPALCQGALIARGGEVPFTITVRITGARPIDGVQTATSIKATYTNPRRINLTPCRGSLGHDAASYSGRRAS